MKFRFPRFLFAALSLLATGCVDAQNPPLTTQAAQEAHIKKAIEPKLGGAKVDSVKATPYAGLFEVRTSGDIIYTDKNAQYLFIGQVFDTKNQQNLTKARIDEINKIRFADLPLDSAVKMVRGDGKRVIAIFEDPNCSFCKRFRRETLKNTDNITVYTFLYNILSEDSAAKSRDIWCAADRNKAWDDWMIDGKLPGAAPANCSNPNERVMALGQQLRLNATPTIFFADGSRVAGAIDAKTLEERLQSAK
jgi:thiol:disulfide interchange protein DsbC